jgi:hypothetical protein
VSETQTALDAQFDLALSNSPRIEPLLGLALGVLGGLLESAVVKSSLLSGGLLGAGFGLVFGLFFFGRATSPGAGLIWGRRGARYSGRISRVHVGQQICLGPRHSSRWFRRHPRRLYLRSVGVFR